MRARPTPPRKSPLAQLPARSVAGGRAARHALFAFLSPTGSTFSLPGRAFSLDLTFTLVLERVRERAHENMQQNATLSTLFFAGAGPCHPEAAVGASRAAAP